MANRNECFSDFSKQKTAMERYRWHSLVSRIGDRETPLPFPPSLCGRTDGRSYADVITKFSRLDELQIFLTHGAPLARFSRWSSAISLNPIGDFQNNMFSGPLFTKSIFWRIENTELFKKWFQANNTSSREVPHPSPLVRWRHNQIFSAWWVTNFSYPWCFAR